MAKKKSPAFQFYPDAWLSSTHVSLMTPAEEGAYIRLLCHAWMATDCGLPDDDAALAELSRLRSQWAKSSARIRERFTAIGGRLFNDRLIEEREKQRIWHEKSSFGGKQSATKRATKKQPPLNHPCNLVEGLVQPNGQPKANISSSSSSSECVVTEGVTTHTERACGLPVLNGRVPLQQRRAVDMDPGEQPSQRFEEFWGAYPRKFDRDSACRDWISVVTVGNEQRVFACLRRYQASDEVRRGVVMNAGSSMRDVGWIIRCHRDGWESDWPAARTQEVKLSRVESVVEEAKRLGRKAC